MIGHISISLGVLLSAPLSLPGCADKSAPSKVERTDVEVASGEPKVIQAANRPAGTTFEDVLAEYQAYNHRLSRVAAPLRLENAALCPNTRRDPGFSVHRLEDYPAPLRPMAESFLGVKPEGLFVRAVRPNSSAAKARVAPGDQILAVNENAISADTHMQSYNRAVLRTGFDSVLSKVKIQTPSGHEYLARIRPDTACDIPAKVVFSQDINGHTDGRNVLITSALMQSVPDDTNLALVIAHEMAHVIAGHADQDPSQVLELEADRMALVLMARAGYDIDAAVTYWKNAAHPHEGGSAAESSHPSTRERYQNFRNELARINKFERDEAIGF